MATTLTPDQLHRLIDEVAELAYGDRVNGYWIEQACYAAGCGEWWRECGFAVFMSAFSGRLHNDRRCFAGLSAVLILLSEGG